MDLPKLTAKQNKCILRYFTNDKKKIEAYRFAYDCSNMSDETVEVEASRFFSNPKITPWLDFFEKNTQQAMQEEIKYTQLEHFRELEEMKEVAMMCSDKNNNPNVNAAIKAVELKGKLMGLYVDKLKVGTEGLADFLDKLK